MSEKEVDWILIWAAQLADQYNLGIAGIISSFTRANKILQNAEKAKLFIESEMKSMRREKQ